MSAPRPPQPFPGVAKLYYGKLRTEFVFGCPADTVRLLVDPLTQEDINRGMGICSGVETILTGVTILSPGWMPGWVHTP